MTYAHLTDEAVEEFKRLTPWTGSANRQLARFDVMLPHLAKANDPARGTKERRDALRQLVHTYLTEPQTLGKMEMYPGDPISGIDDEHFVGARTVAQFRNALTMDGLVVWASGIFGPKAANGYSTATHTLFGPHIHPSHTKDFHDFIVGVAREYAAVAHTTTTTKAPSTMTTTTKIDAANFSKIDGTVATLVNANLTSLGLPSLKEIGAALKEAQEAGEAATRGINLTIGAGMHYAAPTAGALPSGTCVAKKASAIFGLTGKAAEPFDFDVPTYEWAAAHPNVPELDKDYQFEPENLMAVLVAIVTNQRTWLYGDTGCGKTTLIEQVAARLNYPVVRVNFDSEITRMDLIGVKDIRLESGHPVTVFTEGVLPQAMAMPCIFLADELDFIRADVAYVFQRALEGKGLTLPEDGGRFVAPHDGFRMFATANTQGQGDETGRYQGAKPQSAALLDRFTCWIKCDYMKPGQLEKLLVAKYPAASDVAKKLSRYAQEHWTAFQNAEVLTPLSARGLMATALTYTTLKAVQKPEAAFKQATDTALFVRAGREDAQTMRGLMQRVS